jgi:hypothetical protein
LKYCLKPEAWFATTKLKKHPLGPEGLATNLKPAFNALKEEIINRETKGFFDSIKLKQELRAYLKKESIYTRVTKPYNDAKNLITQAEAYKHYDELEQIYTSLQA